MDSAAGDRDCFSRAIERIYAAAMDPTAWPSALQCIADCFEDAGAILLYNREDGGFSVVPSDGIAECVKDYIDAGWNFRDVRALRSRRLGYFVGRDTITDRDVISEQEMAAEPFYSEFLARNGLKYFAAAMVSPDPKVEVAISVQRRVGRAPYASEELALLNELGRHVEQALRLSARLIDSDLLAGGLLAAFDATNVGVFALDAHARVIFSNAAASGMIGDGIELVGEQLRFRDIGSAAGTPAQPITVTPSELATRLSAKRPVVIARASASKPFVLHFLPITQGDRSADFLSRASALVMSVYMELGDSPDPSLVRDVFNLTLAEAKVASLVGSGLSPKSAAAKLDITEETARSVLKRVYSKIGVGRQSELTGLLSRLHIGTSNKDS